MDFYSSDPEKNENAHVLERRSRRERVCLYYVARVRVVGEDVSVIHIGMLPLLVSDEQKNIPLGSAR